MADYNITMKRYTGGDWQNIYPKTKAENIISGTFNSDRIPNLNASKITSGTLSSDRGGTGYSTSSIKNGELLIGGGFGWNKTTLNAGSNVSISNGNGSITINADSPSLTPSDLNVEPTVNTRNTSFTLTESHHNRVFRSRARSNATITLSNTAPIGTTFTIIRYGTGGTTISSTDTIYSTAGGSPQIANQYGVATATKVLSSVWVVAGDLE